MSIKFFGYEIFITRHKDFSTSDIFFVTRDKSLFGVDTHIHILGVYIIVSRNIKA